jgi:hypothetical protein
MKMKFGTPVALLIRQVLCHCRMADVCDDDGVSGESLRVKGAQAPFFFYTTELVSSDSKFVTESTQQNPYYFPVFRGIRACISASIMPPRQVVVAHSARKKQV